jgi:hypothetical protein
MRKQIIGLISIFILVLIVAVISFLPNKQGESVKTDLKNGDLDLESEIVTVPSEGREHLKSGEKAEYKNFPPTSGPHTTDIEWGFYDQPVPFENIVHNLEHSDIVIYYKPSISEQTVKSLKNISQISKDGAGVLVVPNEQISGEIVVTAWTKLLELGKYNEEKINSIYRQWSGIISRA